MSSSPKLFTVQMLFLNRKKQIKRIMELLQGMVSPTVGFLFLQVFDGAVASGVVKRISFLEKDCTISRESNSRRKENAVYCDPQSEWNISPHVVFRFA